MPKNREILEALNIVLLFQQFFSTTASAFISRSETKTKQNKKVPSPKNLNPENDILVISFVLE